MLNVDIGDWFEHNNPFMYKGKKNEVLCFKNYKDIYKQTFEYIAEDCPKGYFDYVLFLQDHCGMDNECSEDFYEFAMKRQPVFRLNKVIHIDWNNLRGECSMLQSILQALHLITETNFSFEAFDWALEEYLQEQEG